MNHPLKPGIRALLGLIAATRVQHERARGRTAEDLASIEAFAKLEREAIAFVDEIIRARERLEESAALLDRVRFAFPSADARTDEIIEERDAADAQREQLGAAALAFDQAFAEVTRAIAPAKTVEQGDAAPAAPAVIAPGSAPPAHLVAKYGAPTMAALSKDPALDAHLAGLEAAWAAAPPPPARGGRVPRDRAKLEPADVGPLFADPNAPPI